MINDTPQSWTPTVSFSTPGDSTFAYINQRGVWTQAGAIFVLNWQLSFTPTFTTAAGNLQIGPIPPNLSPTNGVAFGHFQAFQGASLTFTGTQVFPQLQGRNILLYQFAPNTASILGITSFPSGGTFTVNGGLVGIVFNI